MSKIIIEEINSIEAPGSRYVGWPTIAKTRDGELFIAYSGGRQHHVCPFGQVHLISSRDEGKSWTWPRVLADGPIDDRDGGLLETSRGTLVLNWFTSLAWERHLLTENTEAFHKRPADEQAETLRRSERLTDDVRRSELNAWCIRSTDDGQTWSEKVPTLVSSPHGPCELQDGRLLYVGKMVANNVLEGNKGSPFQHSMGVAESSDDGQSWQMIAEFAPAPGHELALYHEPHAVQAADGTIIAHIRNHNELHQGEVLQTESRDGGHTWSVPHSIGVWGFPSFLLRAADGRLVTTVGHRREPFGNRIAISEDNGQSWGESIAINTDSAGDLGYPSTIELTPGRFISLWYDSKDRKQTYLCTALALRRLRLSIPLLRPHRRADEELLERDLLRLEKIHRHRARVFFDSRHL